MLKFYSVFKSFEKKYQLSIISLIFFMIFIAALELFSVGMVIPLISKIINPNGNVNFPLSHLISQENFKIEYIIILFVIIYFLKTLFLLFFQKLKFLKIFHLQRHLSNIVLNNYLLLPTNSLININTSEITRNVLNEIHLFIKSYLVNILDFVLEILITIFIIAFLILYNPSVSLSILLPVGLTGLVIYQLTKKKIVKVGVKRQIFSKFAIQAITEIFSSIKEIKIYEKEKFANQKFNEVNSMKLQSEQKQSYYLIIPRAILELIVVVCILFVIFLHVNMNNPDELITILALFGAAAFKIFPATNKMVTTFQRLKFADPATQLIIKEIKKYKKNLNTESLENSNPKSWNSITIKDLSFSFDDKQIFKNVNLKINKNEKICLMGESGTGKTTLLNLFLMLYKTKKDYLFFDNKISVKKDYWNKIISYLPQDVYLFDSSIKDNVTFMENEEEFDEKKFKKAVGISLLDEIILSQPAKEKEIVAEFGMKFSGGQRQRIGIARCIYKSREIMIFDESTSQLDQETEEKIVQNIISTNKTIIFVTHKKHLKKYFDKVFLIKDKNIIQSKLNNND